MTSKLDRIQENADKYIVKNCPSCIISPSCCARYHIDNGHAKDCQDIEDCVIKQIITICKWYKMSKKDMKRSKESADIIRGSKYGSDALAIQILQLFDIEEVNK